MQKLLNAGLAAGLFAVSSVAMAADIAVISQNGGAPVIVTPGQTGDGYAPYLLGTLGALPTTLDVSLDIPESSSFGDFAVFTVPPGTNTSGIATPITQTISASVYNYFSAFSASLYSGVISPFGTAAGATLLTTFVSTATSGTFSAALSTGNYFVVVNGVANEFGNLQPKYNLTLNALPVPEPGSIALMLAGLGVVGFLSARRQRV
jgi:PEP-CTERM motif